MEYDVTTALEGLGHDVIHVPVADELKPIRAALKEHRPHVAFNLLMHFHDAGIYDSAVVAWLELRKQRTGYNPRGLLRPTTRPSARRSPLPQDPRAEVLRRALAASSRRASAGRSS